MSVRLSCLGVVAIAVLMVPPSALAQFGGGGMGGMDGGIGGLAGQLPTSISYERRAADSEVAEAARAALDAAVELPVGELPLAELPEHVFQAAGVPVMLDARGLQMAEVAASAKLNIVRSEQPLRTILREALAPLNLQAVVEQEGLLITVDPTALSRSGKPMSQWVNINDADARRLDKQLDNVTSLLFIDDALDQVLQKISTDNNLTLILDVRALEDVGLAPDEPVTLDLKNVRLRTGLTLMLERAELTFVNCGEFLRITTQEAAEGKLLTRIYWLDGVGTHDMETLVATIQASVQPNSWEMMGGASTITPLTLQRRKALVVSTTTDLHHEIDAMLEVLRANHFGNDAKYELVEEPAVGGLGGQGFGGGMGGMGGGGGGMSSGGMF